MRGQIREALRHLGFAVVGPLDEVGFQALTEDLGDVVRRDRIAIEHDARTYVGRPDAVPFHTDHPEVAVVAWRCVVQDPHDGASLLLDARAVLARLDEDDRRTLAEVSLPCPPLAGGTLPASLQPIVDAQARFFYAPWLGAARPDHPSPPPAVLRMRAAISALAIAPTARVRLAPGEVLLVDNRRVMHARGPIARDSRRRLARAWIACK